MHTSLVTKLVKQCTAIPQLKQFHAHLITHKLLNPFILTNILHSLTSLITPTITSPIQLSHYANSLFTLIPNPSTFSYNNLIRVHTLFSSPLPALHLFVRMRQLSIPPDSHTFPFTLKACSQLPSSLPLLKCLHGQSEKFGLVVDLFVCNNLIKAYSVFLDSGDAWAVFNESSVRDVVSYNTLIDCFVKCGEMDRARELFHAMPARDSTSWGTLLAGYAAAEECREVIELFSLMMVSEPFVRPDNVALVAALSACAQLGELELGQRVHNYISGNGVRIDAFLLTALVDFYSKCGDIEMVKEIFECCSDKNVFAWNAMLVGLAMHGEGRITLDYFGKMIKAGVRPDGVSFLGVLVACSHAGLVDEARSLFYDMESVHKVPRELKHYGCMFDLLARAGLIKEAMLMIEGMPTDGDVFVWGGLLGGCRIHGNIEIAEKAADNVMALDPEDGGVYSVMANVYANADHWDEASKVRRLIKVKRVKKNAGCSLIKLNGINHEFIAGDSLHPQTDEIYFLFDGFGKHYLGTS